MTDDKFCSGVWIAFKGRKIFYNCMIPVQLSRSIPEDLRFPKSVVNETLVKELGFASNEEALGKRFWIGMNGWHAEITGVVADFNIGSLHEAIKPTLITQYIPFAKRWELKYKQAQIFPA